MTGTDAPSGAIADAPNDDPSSFQIVLMVIYTPLLLAFLFGFGGWMMSMGLIVSGYKDFGWKLYEYAGLGMGFGGGIALILSPLCIVAAALKATTPTEPAPE